MKKKAFEIAPMLRSLTFDGEKCEVVVFKNRIDYADLSCSADELPASFERGMHSVVVHGVGSFLLGSDYDDAVNGTAAAPMASGLAGLFCNRICLVVGGTHGVGEGIVREMSAQGALVVVADSNISAVRKLVLELNELHGRTVAFGVSVRVSDEKSVERMIHEAVGLLGGVDLLVYNEAPCGKMGWEEKTKEDFQHYVDQRLTGFFLCAKHAAEAMKLTISSHRNHALDIVDISSCGESMDASGLARCLAAEFSKYRIKVNVVRVEGSNPIESGASDVVRAIQYLVWQRNATGQILSVGHGDWAEARAEE